MNVFLSYPNASTYFKFYFPTLKIVTDLDDIKTADLVIFPGGEDINPEIYGEKNIGHSYVNPSRDDYEQLILKTALEYERKIFAVCRGHQFVNANLGGKLMQEIRGTDYEHTQNHPLEYHGKREENIIQRYFKHSVNSTHHQGVIKAGDGQEIFATYKGIIESTYSKNIFTVQFHPEYFLVQTIPFFNFIREWSNGLS